MSNPGPQVSVLVPVRNGAATLAEAIESIRGQSFHAWEIVAVDDGSDDGSLEILEAFVRRDRRIRVLAGARAGIVSALEMARRHASAPILARMDADDRAAPGRLEAQVSLLRRRPHIALCGTHVRYFPRATVRGGARRYEAWLNSIRNPLDIDRNLWIECPLAHPSFAMRSEVLEALGGYRDMGWPEDYDLVLRLWTAGRALDVVPEILLHWREGEGRLSRVDPRYSAAAFRRAKLHFLARTLLPHKDGLLVWGAGPLGKAFAREARRQGIRIRAFVELDGRKIGQEIHGAPVISPREVARFRECLALAAVGQPGGRAQIRSALSALGWVEGADFVAIA